MAAPSTMITLPQMVDLALGSPEVGAVNFNVLHSLLHVMIQQMDLRSTQVEFRGVDSDRIQAILQTAPPYPSIKLSEYVISVDSRGEFPQKVTTSQDKRKRDIDRKTKSREADSRKDRDHRKAREDEEEDEIEMMNVSVLDDDDDDKVKGKRTEVKEKRPEIKERRSDKERRKIDKKESESEKRKETEEEPRHLREKEKFKDKDKEKERTREKEKVGEREDRGKEKEKDRSREPGKTTKDGTETEEDEDKEEKKDRGREKEKVKDREKIKEKESERERGKEREMEKDKVREKEKGKYAEKETEGRDREKEREKGKDRERDKEDRGRDKDRDKQDDRSREKVRDKEDRGRDRERDKEDRDRGRDKEDRVRDKERDKEEDRSREVRDKEDRGRDRERDKEDRDRGRDKEDRGRDRERDKEDRDRGRDKEDRGRDRERDKEDRDRGRDKEDRVRDRDRDKEDKGRGRDKEDRVRDKEDKGRGRDKEDRERDKEDRDRRSDKEDRVRDKEDRDGGKDKEDRIRDRDRGKEDRDRGRDKEDRVRDREQDREDRDRDRERDKEDRNRGRDKDDRDRGKVGDKEWDREDRERDKEDRDREKVRDRERDKEYRGREKDDRDRSGEKDGRGKGSDREREKEGRDRVRDKDERDRGKDRDREKDTEREKDRDREYARDKIRDKEKGQEQGRGEREKYQGSDEDLSDHVVEKKSKKRRPRYDSSEEEDEEEVPKKRRPARRKEEQGESYSRENLQTVVVVTPFDATYSDVEMAHPGSKRTDARSDPPSRTKYPDPASRSRHADSPARSKHPDSPSRSKIPDQAAHRRPVASVVSVASKESLDKIEKTVIHLQNQLAQLEQLPSNEDLISRSRTPSQVTPVYDMWHILNLTKRMDAAESGINKMTSMVEDLAKDTDQNKSMCRSIKTELMDYKDYQDHITNIERRVWDVEHRLGITERKVTISQQRPEDGAERSSQTKLPMKPTAGSLPQVSFEGLTTDEIITALRNELEGVKADVNDMNRHIQQFATIADTIPFDTLCDGIKDLDELRNKLATLTGELKEGAPGEMPDTTKLAQLEERLNNFAGQMHGIDSSFSSQMDSFQLQISDMEKELGLILERLNAGMPMGDAIQQDVSGLTELYGKIQALQTDIDNVNMTSTRLLEDRDDRQVHINALLEQIELLKTVKADREDLEDALADKADQNAVNRKVSHDQFDAALEDISKGLEEAVGKLSQQESLWQQAMDDVQHEIENKLDKMEISPLKDFVNSKLKVLQERLKALAAIRRESEAAGTKMKLLRNVNCISCDKDVVMRKEVDVASIPAPDGLPTTRSMRPYLTYELDMIRRQQKRLPFVRNMINYESTLKEEDYRKTAGKAPVELHHHGKGLDHLCNRYCGGSHTITTPQQRVTRVGHFLNQWGPEAIQLTEDSTKGTDGEVYKARTKLSRKISPGSPRKTLSPTKVILSTPKQTLSHQISPTKQQPTSKVTSATPKATTPVTHKGSLIAAPKATLSPKVSPTKKAKSSPGSSPKGSPKGSPRVSPKGSPKGSPKVSPRTSPQELVGAKSSPTLHILSKGSQTLVTGSQKTSSKLSIRSKPSETDIRQEQEEVQIESGDMEGIEEMPASIIEELLLEGVKEMPQIQEIAEELELESEPAPEPEPEPTLPEGSEE